MNRNAISSGGMKRSIILVLILFLMPVAQGCVSAETPKMKDDLSSLKKQLHDLQQRTAELELKSSQNVGDITLLSERMNMALPDSAKRDVLAGGMGGPKADFGKRVDRTSRFGDLSPEEVYKLSLMRFNQGNLNKAVEGFFFITRRFKDIGIAQKAQFWLGEIYFNQKRYVRAAEEYKKVLLRYKHDFKRTDAMLKIGFCKIETNKVDEGSRILIDLIVQYPDSLAALQAKERLSDIGLGLEYQDPALTIKQ